MSSLTAEIPAEETRLRNCPFFRENSELDSNTAGCLAVMVFRRRRRLVLDRSAFKDSRRAEGKAPGSWETERRSEL